MSSCLIAKLFSIDERLTVVFYFLSSFCLEVAGCDGVRC